MSREKPPCGYFSEPETGKRLGVCGLRKTYAGCRALVDYFAVKKRGRPERRRYE
jgi:hypothetical protein